MAKGQPGIQHPLCELGTAGKKKKEGGTSAWQTQLFYLQDKTIPWLPDVYPSSRFRQALVKSGWSRCLRAPLRTFQGSGSTGVNVTWLFKKWQRELLIVCTRTDRAAAVTFNGIIDWFLSATTGVGLFLKAGQRSPSWRFTPNGCQPLSFCEFFTFCLLLGFFCISSLQSNSAPPPPPQPPPHFCDPLVDDPSKGVREHSEDTLGSPHLNLAGYF